MEETRETIRAIKKELRLYMNGVTSAQMRKMGMNYNIIFGVSIPHLKEIAVKFKKESTLARELWKENIRESKLLAIFLLPEEEYTSVADKWPAECRYHENADHLAHQILSKLPDATEKAIEWTLEESEITRYCGFQTLSHLFRQGKTLTAEQEETFFASATNEASTTAVRALTCYFDQDNNRLRRYKEIFPGQEQ